MLFTGDGHRCTEALLAVVKCLPSSVIIDRCPGSNRPDVIQLPDNCSHAGSANSAEIFHTVADCIQLQHLRAVKKLIEILRIPVGCRQVIHNLSVGRRISLVHLHHLGENIPVLRLRKRTDRLHTGERLEAELRKETEVMLPVIRELISAMPYAPVMRISDIFLVDILVIAA